MSVIYLFFFLISKSFFSVDSFKVLNLNSLFFFFLIFHWIGRKSWYLLSLDQIANISRELLPQRYAVGDIIDTFTFKPITHNQRTRLFIGFVYVMESIA